MVKKFSDLQCPIGTELFEDPVKAEDGRTYSRAMIEAWFKSLRDRGKPITSPWTRQAMGETLKQDEQAVKDVVEYLNRKAAANLAQGEDLRSILAGKASIHDLREIFVALDDLRPILLDSLQHWKPPQLVMIGQESSGKSSVLERLAMMPIFPRDDNVCTRLPIHVRLRFAEVCQPATLEVYNTKTNTIEEGPYVIPTATGAIDVRDKMAEIIESEGVKVSTERMIVLSVNSPNVASIDLVDMPGLVTSPPETKLLTHQLLTQHIKQHGHYSLYLATVPASSAPNASTAMEFVQSYSLEKKTIGVFTMCDEVAPGRPLNIFMKRCLTPQIEECGGVVLEPQGWVGVVNAHVGAEGVEEGNNLERLSQQAADEEAFMQDKMLDLVQQERGGCGALVAKINTMFIEFLSRQWGPQTVRGLNKELQKVDYDDALLGIPAFDETGKAKGKLARKLAAADARERVSKSAPELIDSYCQKLQEVKKELMQAEEQRVQNVKVAEAWRMWQEQRAKMQQLCESAISNWEAHWVDGLKDILERRASQGQQVASLIASPCFELYRFPGLVSAIMDKFKALLQASKTSIRTAVEAYLEDYYSADKMSPLVSLSSDLSASPATVSIAGEHVKLVEWIVFAFIRQSSSVLLEELPKSFDTLAAGLSSEALVESCQQERRMLRARKLTLQSAKAKILQMLKVDTEKELFKLRGVIAGQPTTLTGLTAECGCGIVVDSEGLVYVSDHSSRHVKVFQNGAMVRSFAVPFHPRGMAIDEEEQILYVSTSSGNNYVYVYSKNGDEKGTLSVENSHLQTGIAVGRSEVFVADAQHCRIDVFPKVLPSPQRARTIIPGQDPRGLALDEEAGLLYITIHAQPKVLVHTTAGSHIEDLQLDSACDGWGAITLLDGRVFVATKNFIEVFRRDAGLKHTREQVINVGFHATALYMDGNGTLLAGTSSEVRVIDVPPA